MALFDAHQLACQRGERLLFLAVDFRLEAGSALLLMGANGSGKSSLLRLAAGLSRPLAGDFLWQGRPIGDALDQHHRRTVYLGHGDAVKPGLTVRENLRFWADLAGLRRHRAGPEVDRAIDYFALDDLIDLPTRFLSAGQKRRLTLARLLLQPAADRPLWLLDEPTTALDTPSQQRLTDLMLRHLTEGGLALIASHDLLSTMPGQRLQIDDFQPHYDDMSFATPDDIPPQPIVVTMPSGGGSI